MINLDDLYGSSKCPYCGNDILKGRDLWERFGKIEGLDFNNVEVHFTCPFEDCHKELLVCYDRVKIEGADD